MPQTALPTRIIALDLDGTLLNSSKALSPADLDALTYAASMGTEIVPTTGRFFDAIPGCVRDLPFLHYAITVNGAVIYDIRRKQALSRTEIPLETALEVMAFLDHYPVLYDCYQSDRSYISRHFQENAHLYMDSPYFLAMIRDLRLPVPDLQTFLRETGKDVQKIMVSTMDEGLRSLLFRELSARFPRILATSSLPTNIEINDCRAHKGAALRRLAEILGFDISQTVAFGDGTNDISMLRTAGIGFAMANSVPEVLAAADRVTASNDENGVAAGIRQLIF